MSIRSLIVLQAFVALNLASLHVRAGEVPFPQCPQSLPIQQVVKTHPVDGWKIVNNNNTQRLISIGISSEEYPAIQTGLDIPTEEKLAKGDRIDHYETTPFVGGEHDYWAVCKYSDSDVVLVQKLPENVVRCEVKYYRDITPRDSITIKCFDSPRKAK